MTIDDERWQAIESARTLLNAVGGNDPFAVLSPAEHRRIPARVREIARGFMEFYPELSWTERAREKVDGPDEWVFDL